MVDFTTYNVLARGHDWTSYYEVCGQKIVVANNISVFLAVVSNFIINKHWTFRAQKGAVVSQWTCYFVMSVMTWILNQILVSLLTFKVPLIVQLFPSQGDNAAKVIAISVILFFNFAGSKFIIFRRKTPRL